MSNHVNKSMVRAAAMAATLGFGLFAAVPTWADDLTFVVEPLYGPQRAQEVYKPLVAYLSKATGHNIKLVTPKNYHFYWRDVRQNVKFDFTFDEAHLTDYRIKRYNYEPLARTAEATGYSLMVNFDLAEKGKSGLVGRSIVSMPAPSLGYALLLEMYPNAIAQPDIQSSAASWTDAVEIVAAGEADAAIVPNWLKAQYESTLAPIEQTAEFAGAAVNAHPDVSAQVKQDIKVALLKLHEDPAGFEVLAGFGVTQFVEATPAEYDGAEAKLRGFFGYK